MNSALAFFFQIHYPTPIKLTLVALVLVNSGLMLWLSVRRRNSWFALYLGFMAVVTLIQVSPLWGQLGEVWLILLTTLWVTSLLPEDLSGRIFSLSIALLLAGILTAVVPPPWPNFPPALYFSRLYSTLVFLGISLASYLWSWTVGDRERRGDLIAALWFAAVLFAGIQRGIDYWVAGITAKLVWTGCLAWWLTRDSRAATALRRA